MTAKQIVKAEQPIRKIVFGVLQWGAIAFIGWVLLTGQQVVSNSQKGGEAYENMQTQDKKIDSVCVRVDRIESNQRVINVGLQKDVEYIKENIYDIKGLVQEIRENQR